MDAKRGLVRHGVTLFLVGLLTGFVVPLTANPRAGLASHLEGPPSASGAASPRR